MASIPSSYETEDFTFSPPTAVLEVTYTPDSSRRQSWHIWRTIIDEFLNNRELIWCLILRDVSVRYRQSVFGYLWQFYLQLLQSLSLQSLRSPGQFL